MEIRNVTQFVGFVNSTGISSLDGIFLQVSSCVNKYASACNCHKAADKMKLYEECNRLYRSAVNILPKFKNAILPKISEGRIAFYMDNGSLISILAR